MKILIYGHRKMDAKMYDISTPEKELAAYLLVFKELEFNQVYADLDDIKLPEICEPCEKGLHSYCVAAESRRSAECGCSAGTDCLKRAERANRAKRQLMTWQKWMNEARAGNGESAKKLLTDRSHRQYEYEIIEFGSVIDPLETKNASQTA